MKIKDRDFTACLCQKDEKDKGRQLCVTGKMETKFVKKNVSGQCQDKEFDDFETWKH